MLKILKQVRAKVWLRHSWGIIVFKKQKQSTSGVLIYLKCERKSQQGSYIVENAKIRYGTKIPLRSYSVQKAKIKIRHGS